MPSYTTGIGAIKSCSGEDNSERVLILIDIEALTSGANLSLIG